MPMRDIFFDSSAMIAGIVSSQGAARALLLLGEDKKVTISVSEQVIAEVERNIARKVPGALPFARELMLHSHMRILRDPPIEAMRQHLDWISHAADVPILVAAVSAGVDYLVTLNTRHFIDDPEVARRSGLHIGTPGEVLAWVRGELGGIDR
jgi:predicted nucleic acid-binding protein